MKVSVVVPAFNEEKYIKDTLNAVLALDYPDFEVIVVDNNSSDNTANIARTYQKVKVVQEKNKGTQFARERGRKEATGEIIACVDADCHPDKEWLKKALPYFNNPNVVAVGGPYDYYDATFVFKKTSLIVQKFFYIPINTLLQLFGFGAVMIAGNSLIRASALEKLGGYDTSFIFYGDDTNTAKRLAKLGKVIFSPKVIMKTSARRFKSQGTVKIFLMYVYHFLKIIFTNKKPRG